MTSLPSSQIISKTAGACLTQTTSHFNILVSIRNICSSFSFSRHSKVHLGVFVLQMHSHDTFRVSNLLFFVCLFCYSIIFPLSQMAFDDFLKSASKKNRLQSSVSLKLIYFSYIFSLYICQWTIVVNLLMFAFISIKRTLTPQGSQQWISLW